VGDFVLAVSPDFMSDMDTKKTVQLLLHRLFAISSCLIDIPAVSVKNLLYTATHSTFYARDADQFDLACQGKTDLLDFSYRWHDPCNIITPKGIADQILQSMYLIRGGATPPWSRHGVSPA